ncbi:MAG: hypothetical protein IJ624_04120 [Prevotella sp.]|nr:hypothetical protein [Prevotella sp.]
MNILIIFIDYTLIVIGVGIYLIIDGRDSKKSKYAEDQTLLQKVTYYASFALIIVFSPVLTVGAFIFFAGFEIYQYFSMVIEHGGVVKYHKWKRQKEQEREERKLKEMAQREIDKKLEEDYLNGVITRYDLPRAVDGEVRFEFDEDMVLPFEYNENVSDLIYVETEYCESLNRFFQNHKGLRLYQMYRFIYLPNLIDGYGVSEQRKYLSPQLDRDDVKIDIDSSYPLQYLWYEEDKKKISHGMFLFISNCNNRGARFIQGHFYPLNEGSDEDVIRQLDDIVKKAHSEYSLGGLYSTIQKPDIEEGAAEDYADQLFSWTLKDDEVAILVEEVRERIKKLKEKGIAERLLLNLVKDKLKFSRLIITKDMRIILPDFHSMEIEMEPINKAVFLLFLRHPEGIIFKHLPDYREELAEIYQKIKPLGLNERAIRSIEDVTNPCLNSINEKCARIRGAFISKFDEDLARHYYINGNRGEAKKIALPRELVIWE